MEKATEVSNINKINETTWVANENMNENQRKYKWKWEMGNCNRNGKVGNLEQQYVNICAEDQQKDQDTNTNSWMRRVGG